MVAYRGPREGHDAWQGDAYHQYIMDRTAEHIGHPVEKAHELHMMRKGVLKGLLEEAGPLPKDIPEKAMMHQANVNRAHPEYEHACARRKRLCNHDEAKAHWTRMQELLTEHHEVGTTQKRQLEIHAELKGLQDKVAQIEERLT
jgi:hypothetical protein